MISSHSCQKRPVKRLPRSYSLPEISYKQFMTTVSEVQCAKVHEGPPLFPCSNFSAARDDKKEHGTKLSPTIESR